MHRHALIALAALFLATQSPVEITAEPHHHLTFANEQVRVFYVDVPTHDETLIHRHRHDYIYVMLGEVELSNQVEGQPLITLKLHDGDTNLNPAPIPFAHAVRTLSDTPFRNVTVEILQDEKLRHVASPWKEDRGLSILEGGTGEILFVKDAIRATKFELQPNAAIPSQRPHHALLLIAINDLDLYTDDPRIHDAHEPVPKPIHLNSGNCTWLPNGMARPIVNAGHNNARFVTLEFP